MTISDIIYCAILISFIVMVLTSFFYEKKTKIVPAPTLPSVRAEALNLIPKTFSRDGQYQIFDLGCGWGGLLVALSKMFPNATIVGYELSPWPFFVSKIRALIHSKNVKVYREDFFKKDISNADVIFCYLSPYHMRQLKMKFADMPSGKCIISCSFPIPDWVADEVVYVQNYFVKIPIYYYITSERKE